jgi:tetratricopeptide (TPR) repeat protein
MLLLISVGGAVTYYVVYDEGPWPTMGKGYRLFDAGRYEEATAVFQQVTEAYTDFAEGHAALGHALAARERFDDAIAAYTRAIELDGEYLGARTGRGWVRWFTGRLEGAAEDYRAAVRLDPDVYGYYLELERVLYELDRPREVAEFWKEVADNKPDWAADARVKRVQALEKDQDWSALRRELPAMMGMDAHKNDPHLDYLMGRSLNEAGRHGRAITFLQRAVNTILAGDPPNKNLLKLYGDELKYTYVWNDQLDEGRSWEQRLNRLLKP